MVAVDNLFLVSEIILNSVRNFRDFFNVQIINSKAFVISKVVWIYFLVTLLCLLL